MGRFYSLFCTFLQSADRYRLIFTILLSVAFLTTCANQIKIEDAPIKPPKNEPEPSKNRNCTKKPLVVAVIDTGFGWMDLGKSAKLCKYGHRNFSEETNTTTEYGTKAPVPLDSHGHGTHIAGTIEKNAGDANFCMVILKYYTEKSTGQENLFGEIAAIRYAAAIKADFINYSGGGILRSKEEEEAITKYIDAGGVFIAAAGNERVNADFFHFYPANYDRVISVGNGVNEELRAPSSNYGKSVTRWERGSNVEAYGFYMSGTSQAAAIATGKLIAEKNQPCN